METLDPKFEPTIRVVKFRHPINEVEAAARMIMIEDRGPRMLVCDLAFIADPNWRLKPTNVYATADLVDDRCLYCGAALYKGTCVNDGEFETEEDRAIAGALWSAQFENEIVGWTDPDLEAEAARACHDCGLAEIENTGGLNTWEGDHETIEVCDACLRQREYDNESEVAN